MPNWFRLLPYAADAWRNVSVLEIAAAGGGGLYYLRKQYQPREAIGIELSSVAAWRGRRLSLDIRQGDASRLPFENRRFDCVICVDALAYFPQHDFINEIGRVLKPNGRALFASGMPGTATAARDYFVDLSAVAGMEVESFSDLSAGVRLSLQHVMAQTARRPLLGLVKYLPAALQNQLRDTLTLPGSQRYELWQSGAFCMAAPILRLP